MGGKASLTNLPNDPIEVARPHRIPQDHKYQSWDLFDKSGKKIGFTHGLSDSAPPPYLSSNIPSRPIVRIENQTPRKRRNIICCAVNEIHICNGTISLGWILVILLVIVFAAILTPVVIIKFPRHSAPSGFANSTASNTTIVVLQGSTVTRTQQTSTVTQTQTPTTVLVTQSRTSTSLTTSSASQPPSIPTPISGFAAYGWSTGDIQLFYIDPSLSQSNIYSSQYLSGSWSSPVLLASDAINGTTLSLSVVFHDFDISDSDYYPVNLSDDIEIWRLVYIDQSNTLQALEKQVQYDDDAQSVTVDITGIAGSSGWTKGNLGTYGYKAAPSLYQQSCAWASNVSEVNADMYLYFDTANGTIMKLAYAYSSNTWVQVSDMPDLFSNGNKAIDCTSDPSATDNYSGFETMWVINSSNELEQWYGGPFGASTSTSTQAWASSTPSWTSSALPYVSAIPRQVSSTSTWKKGFTYPGPIAENTSLTSLSNGYYGYNMVFYQAPNASIMQLPVHGVGPNAVAQPASEFVVAQPGTRLGIATDADTSSPSLFYQKGRRIVNQKFSTSYSSGYVYPNGGSNSLMKGNSSSCSWLLLACFFLGVVLQFFMI